MVSLVVVAVVAMTSEWLLMLVGALMMMVFIMLFGVAVMAVMMPSDGDDDVNDDHETFRSISAVDSVLPCPAVPCSVVPCRAPPYPTDVFTINSITTSNPSLFTVSSWLGPSAPPLPSSPCTRRFLANTAKNWTLQWPSSPTSAPGVSATMTFSG